MNRWKTTGPLAAFAPAILLFLLLISVQVDKANGLACHQCLEGEWTPFCNASANTQQCTRAGDVCFTQVKESASHLLTSWKGCMPRQTCQTHENANNRLCQQGTITGVCSWCCEHNHCNYDRVAFTRLTTPTTTVSTTPSHPRSGTTTVAPSSCKDLDLTSCIKDYRHEVQQVVKDPANFNSFCGHVPDVFHCLANKMHGCFCIKPNDDKTLLQHVFTLLRTQCPRACNTDAGLQCTVNVQERILKVILDPKSTCQLLKREINTYLECVSFSTSSCGDTVYKKFTVSVGVMEEVIKTICPMIPDSTLPPPRSTRPMTSAPLQTSTHNMTSSTAAAEVTSPLATETTASVQTFPTRPTVTSVAPTEHPDCDVDVALRCVAKLGQEIVRIRDSDGDFTDVCHFKLFAAELCARESTESCSLVIRDRVEMSLQYIYGLLGNACDVTTTPPRVCDTTGARLCIVRLFELVETRKDIQKACNSIENVTRCVVERTAGCTQREKASLNSTLQIVLNKFADRCGAKPVQCYENNTVVILVEGGSSQTVQFKVNFAPDTLCTEPGCRVYVDFLPDDSGKSPMCGSGYPISQFVIGGGGSDASCSREITDGNWRDTQTVHLTAKIDFKYDGNQTRDLIIVLRKVVKGKIVERQTICVYKVLVVDKDSKHFCKAIGDPHIYTFDNLFTDHFYEGIFRLYRHKEFPYEVQTVFKRCGKYGTCTCAVYVRAGDTVFYADRCDRKAGRDCRRVRSGSRYRTICTPRLVTRIFFNAEITPGMRVYRKDDGNTFDVILPHGTLIRIETHRNGFLNVYVYPSPYDWKNTEGLCGTYDGDSKNDLTLPDGSIYPFRFGRSGRHKRFPTGFCRAWAVPRNEYLVHGYPTDPYNLPAFCECRPSIDFSDSSPVSHCDTRALLETCDFDKGDEVTYDMPPTSQNQQPSVRWVTGRKRRQADSASVLPDLPYDLDFDYEPPADMDANSTWTDESAKAYCAKRMLTDLLYQRCQALAGFDALTDLDICADDIMLTGNTLLVESARSSLMEQCMREVTWNVTYTSTEAGKLQAEGIMRLMCLDSCTANGRCINGKCECLAGYAGADCSLDVKQAPQNVSVDSEGLCDARQTNCRLIILFGRGFANSPNLTCHLEEIEVTEAGVKESGSVHLVKATFLGSEQVICQAAKYLQPYLVRVSLDGVNTSPAELFVPHDSACQNCSYNEDNTPVCTNKTDSCTIDGQCFAAEETSAVDICMICSPAYSTSQLQQIKSIQCMSDTTLVIIVVVIVLVFLVAVVILIICCCWRKRTKPNVSEHAGPGVSMANSTYSTLTKTKPLDEPSIEIRY